MLRRHQDTARTSFSSPMAAGVDLHDVDRATLDELLERGCGSGTSRPSRFRRWTPARMRRWPSTYPGSFGLFDEPGPRDARPRTHSIASSTSQTWFASIMSCDRADGFTYASALRRRRLRMRPTYLDVRKAVRPPASAHRHGSCRRSSRASRPTWCSRDSLTLERRDAFGLAGAAPAHERKCLGRRDAIREVAKVDGAHEFFGAEVADIALRVALPPLREQIPHALTIGAGRQWIAPLSGPIQRVAVGGHVAPERTWIRSHRFESRPTTRWRIERTAQQQISLPPAVW